MNEFYNEIKYLVREPYSKTSKKYDKKFKYNSIEGLIQIRNDLNKKLKQRKIEEQLKKQSAYGNKIRIQSEKYLQSTVVQNDPNLNDDTNINLLLKKEKTLYKEFKTKVDEKQNNIKKKINIDDEINDIFKETLYKKKNNLHNEKNYFISNATLSRRESIITKYKYRKMIKNNIQYFPNYNSIYPHSPVTKIYVNSEKPKLKEPKLQHQLCRKFINEHTLNSSHNNMHKNKDYNNNLFYSLIENNKEIPEGIPKDEENKLIISQSQCKSYLDSKNMSGVHSFVDKRKSIFPVTEKGSMKSINELSSIISSPNINGISSRSGKLLLNPLTVNRCNVNNRKMIKKIFLRDMNSNFNNENNI